MESFKESISKIFRMSYPAMIVTVGFLIFAKVLDFLGFPFKTLNKLWFFFGLVNDETSFMASFISGLIIFLFTLAVISSIRLSSAQSIGSLKENKKNYDLMTLIPILSFFLIILVFIIFTYINMENQETNINDMEIKNDEQATQFFLSNKLMQSTIDFQSTANVLSKDLLQSTIDAQSTQIALLTTLLTQTPGPNEIIKNQIRDYASFLSDNDKIRDAWELLDYKYQEYWGGNGEGFMVFQNGWKNITLEVISFNEPIVNGNLAEIIVRFDYSPLDDKDGLYKICLRYNDERKEWLIYRHLENESKDCSFDYYQ